MPADIRMRTVSVLPGIVRIHFTPKCASASISAALHGTGYKHDFPDGEGTEPRFMAVRHPLDRIVSAWAFFCENQPDVDRQPGLKAIGYYYGMPFEEFLELCLKRHYENAHTRAQSIFAGPHKIDWLVPLYLLPERWEELRKRFPQANIRQINPSHKSEHKPWQDYYTPPMRAAAETIFADDMRLFELAEANS